jgi:hypothetical protein
MSDVGAALGWDDEIDGKARTLLAPGPAKFTISKMERAQQDGGKYAGNRVAVLTMELEDADGNKGECKIRLILNADFMWKIQGMFWAIGDAPQEGAFRPDWQGLIGKSGNCEVEQRDYVTRKGEDRTINDLKEFLAPGALPTPAAEAAPAQQELLDDDF